MGTMRAFLMRSNNVKIRRKFDPNALTGRDILIIAPVVIGFLLLCIFFAFAVSDDVYIKWGGLVLDTSILYGFFLKYSQRYFHNIRFWMLFAATLLVHLTGFAIILTHVDQWKLVWFTGMALEIPVLLFQRNRIRMPS
jgi:hypothetical protein